MLKTPHITTTRWQQSTENVRKVYKVSHGKCDSKHDWKLVKQLNVGQPHAKTIETEVACANSYIFLHNLHSKNVVFVSLLLHAIKISKKSCVLLSRQEWQYSEKKYKLSCDRDWNS